MENTTKLINGDCYKIIKQIPDKSIDLIYTDPPYDFSDTHSGSLQTGGGGCFGLKKRNYHKEYIDTCLNTETSRIDKARRSSSSNISDLSYGIDNSILDEFCRIMKHIYIYIWCSKQQIQNYLNYFLDKGCFFEILTWHKTNPIPACNNTYLSDTEYLLMFREKGTKIGGSYKTKFKYYVSPINTQDKKLYTHPTIKPLQYVKNQIINSSDENDIVLDPFMGSGTTGVACKELNRKFIGIELNKEYYNIAVKRINDTRKLDIDYYKNNILGILDYEENE